MRKQSPDITYTVINPNTSDDLKEALKMAIIEKLLLVHKDASLITNQA